MKKKPLPHVRVFDEKFAESYARRHAKWGKRIGRIFVETLSERSFRSGEILDAGCGSGTVLMEILRAFPEARGIGVDLSEPILEIARRTAQEEGLADRVAFQKADVEELPFEDDRFDMVLNVNMLHIVASPVKMLNEIERVLAPKGEFILNDVKRSWLGYFEHIIKSSYTVEEGVELLKQSNLRPWKLDKGLIWWGALASNAFDKETI